MRLLGFARAADSSWGWCEGCFQDSNRLVGFQEVIWGTFQFSRARVFGRRKHREGNHTEWLLSTFVSDIVSSTGDE